MITEVILKLPVNWVKMGVNIMNLLSNEFTNATFFVNTKDLILHFNINIYIIYVCLYMFVFTSCCKLLYRQRKT